MKRTLAAFTVAAVITVVGAFAVKLADLGEGARPAVALFAAFVASLIDPENFYGTEPRDKAGPAGPPSPG